MLERLFRLQEHKTTLNRELSAGITTFMTMAYIVFVNPAILKNAGVPYNAAVTATCVASGLVTILMGLATNYPLALACGMGLNAMVAFEIVAGRGCTWQVGMGVVVIEGLAVLIFSLTPLRAAIMRAIPEDLKLAIGAGLGLFIAFIGFEQAGIVVGDPVTLVKLGNFHAPHTVLALAGLAITLILFAIGHPAALLFGMLLTGLIGCVSHVIDAPPEIILIFAAFGAFYGALALLRARHAILWAGLAALIFSALTPNGFLLRGIMGNPFGESMKANFATFFQADVRGALTWKLLPVIFAFFMTDFFDTMGTALGVGRQAGFVDENGQIPRLRGLLIVDSLGALLGGLFGCSSVTSYVESASGVAAGGRTGLTCVVVGLGFWLALFFIPLIAVFGGGVEIAEGVFAYPITAPALIIVGFLMIGHVARIRFDQLETGLPAFLTIIGIPLTFSISHGIAFGFISHCLIQIARGRARETHPFLYLVSFLFVLAILWG